MAFTAVHYPMDKDQSQNTFWLNNDELDVVGDNFFDQFITFDPTDPTGLGSVELLENPPSPSILLDSLDLHFANPSSSNEPGLQSRLPLSEAEAPPETNTDIVNQLTLPPPEARIIDQESKSVPPVLNALAADPVLSSGSISDSELLRLEGISIKSPKPSITAPSSPPLDLSLEPLSPRKQNRFVDSVYATIRRATHRTRPQRPAAIQSSNTGDMGLFRVEAGDRHFEMDGYIKPEPIDSHGLPLSPPLTGGIPKDYRPNQMRFVTGSLDDPFCDGLSTSPTVIDQIVDGFNANTPMDTPLINGDGFYEPDLSSLDMVDTAGPSYRPQPKQRSVSSAQWPMEGLLADDSHMWSASPPTAAYIPESDNLASPGWWESATPRGDGDSEHHYYRPHNDHHYHRSNVGPRQHPHHGVSLNLSSAHNNHQAHGDLPYEYNAELSGLMIHMPQPRQPQAAVLSANISDTLLASPRSSNYGFPPSHQPPPSSLHRHGSYHHRSGHGERRPRPRAPSSGARHHGSLTSPRKLHHRGSHSYLREESTSPTPSRPQRPHPPLPHHHPSQRSASMSVRKRRSWCRRSASGSGDSRTSPTAPTSSSRFPPSSSSSLEDGALGGGGRGGGGGGGGGIGFVNFTPSDKNVLMQGVAPSGSSKTKARREKEAAEKRRKFSEAALKAIAAAGGDIDKLVGETFPF